MSARPALAVHGGAGALARDDDASAARAGCERAVDAGWRVLEAGGSAVDAVAAAVVALEDDPIFNAGTGASLDEAGDAVLDASLMDGHGLRAGAVALVRDVKNPVLLARAVMERTPHVLLAGPGASQLADEAGIPRCAPQALVTPRARARWDAARARVAAPRGHGTVGAVAVDREGHVAAATSTGGTVFKRVGRIGDSPLIGAGTYADDAAGAVSMTGLGEAITRVVAAKFACDALRQGASADAAARATVQQLERVGGDGGVVLVTPLGEVGFAFDTARMARAWRDSAGGRGSGFAPD